MSYIHQIFILSAVYNFEANLSPGECVAVHDLSPKTRFIVGNSG